MTMSARGQQLQRSLAMTLELIAEHAKRHPDEAEQLYAALVAHVRSTAAHVLQAGAL